MDGSAEVALSNREQIKIHTLGRFLVTRGGAILSHEATRSRKVWDLFMYFLVHRKKTVLPEDILQTLWPEQEYADPNLAMRSLVFRLRQLLAEILSAPELAANISFSHGCYTWEPKNDCWLDVDLFESLCLKADSIAVDDHKGAVARYQEAVALYKGVFLPEASYYEWTVPLRSYYHRIFVQSVLKLIDLQKKDQSFDEIIKLCERVLMIEYFDEELHLSYIEALLEKEKDSKALAHYEEVTSIFYREMGAKPSAAMQKIYRLIKLRNKGDFDLDLTYVQEALRDREHVKGPLVCDPETFNYFYKLERLRAERSGQSVFLAMLTLTQPNLALPAAKSLKQSMERLMEVLREKLRKGDVVTRWNDAQYLVILPGLNAEQADMVLERIEEVCKEDFAAKNLLLHRKQQVLLPLEQYMQD